MPKTYPLKEIWHRSIRTIALLLVIYLILAGAMLTVMLTMDRFYERIAVGQPLIEAENALPMMREADIGVQAAIDAMPPAWLPERMGIVGGIKAQRGVQLIFLHPMFSITLLVDGAGRVLVKHPTYM